MAAIEAIVQADRVTARPIAAVPDMSRRGLAERKKAQPKGLTLSCASTANAILLGFPTRHITGGLRGTPPPEPVMKQEGQNEAPMRLADYREA